MPPTLGKSQILIVDDSDEVHAHIARELRGRGYSLEFAKDGEQAYEITRANSIGLILLDLHMPKQDGISFLRRLKHLSYQPPCIIVSNESNPAYLSQAKKYGAKGFMTKPLKAGNVDLLYKRFVIEKCKDELF